MGKVVVANDYKEDIYVMVQGDRKFTTKKGFHAGAKFSLAGFDIGADKEVIWETSKTMGYTKIKSKSSTPFYPEACGDAVYVTIFCEGMDRELCRFHPVEKKCNVIFSYEGYLCFSHEKEIWKYEDSKKKITETNKDEKIFELKVAFNKEKEKNLRLQKELKNCMERSSRDHLRPNSIGFSQDDSYQLLPSPRKRAAENVQDGHMSKVQRLNETKEVFKYT